MKLVSINERAAAQAMDFVVGQDMRMLIEKLYDLLDQAEKAGHQEAYNLGYDEGYGNGYSDGIDIATNNAPQPYVVEPTETDGFYEVQDEDEWQEWLADDECACESCTQQDEWVKDEATGNWIERELPAMEEQRPSNPFAWS